MRPLRAEWLLALLVLVPVIGAGVYASRAETSYRGELRRAAENAPDWVLRSVARGRHPFWMDQVLPDAVKVTPLEHGFQFWIADGDGNRRFWVVGDRYPGGASASDLARAERRAALEYGTPAADLAATPPLQRFADLYRTPSLGALRGAQLPAATMLFLLDRLPDEEPIPEGRVPVRDALHRLAAIQSTGGLPPLGLSPTPAGRVFRYGGDASNLLLLLPDDAQLGFARRTLDDVVTVVYGDRPAPDAIWSEQREVPVKGTWSLVATHGSSWWDVPRYRRWVRPGLSAAAIYLLVLAALAWSMRRRRQLDEARARFLTEIAHDLRTPLTSVRLHAELLASPNRRADREAKYRAVLEREAVRASELLANLLDLSRLDRGQRVFEPETRRISDLIQPCLAEFRQLYPDRADDLAAEGDPAATLHVDASAFQRCVTNLLDNAGKYTADGTSMRVVWSPGRVCVEDDGPGVPVRERGRLFERYVRGSRTEGIAGTGLGLSLVKELVEGMGGTVRYSDGDPGARFELRLPGGGHA